MENFCSAASHKIWSYLYSAAKYKRPVLRHWGFTYFCLNFFYKIINWSKTSIFPVSRKVYIEYHPTTSVSLFVDLSSLSLSTIEENHTNTRHPVNQKLYLLSLKKSYTLKVKQIIYFFLARVSAKPLAFTTFGQVRHRILSLSSPGNVQLL